MITRQQFVEATGREPQDDDMARVNCSHAGQMGHTCCGWNLKYNKPQFEIGPAMLKPIAVWSFAEGERPDYDA